jgi:hypothetical protein
MRSPALLQHFEGERLRVASLSRVASCRRISWAIGPSVGQTCRPPVTVPGPPGGLFAENGRPSNSRSKRFGEPPASAYPPRAIRPNAPSGPAHDRGRCPLYVRAQLETAGLT